MGVWNEMFIEPNFQIQQKKEESLKKNQHIQYTVVNLLGPLVKMSIFVSRKCVLRGWMKGKK